MSLIEAFVPRAALCPGFLMTLSALLKSMTTCIREQYLRMIMYLRQYRSLRNLVTNKIRSNKKKLNLFVALTLPKNYGGLFQLQREKAYTLIMYPLILPAIQ